MKLLRNIKGFIYKADFFYTTQLLRYKQETEYRTLFGGVLSLIMIVSFVVIFYNMLINTVNKLVISSTSYSVNSADPTSYNISTFEDGKFMFGVQIWHHDLNTGPRYFDIQMVNVELDSGVRRPSSKEYPLEACRPQHWKDFPKVAKKYNSLNMSNWMCLPKNTTYEIQGKYSSDHTKLLKINVRKCENSTKYQRACAPQEQIDRFLDQAGSLAFTIYFINPLINPTIQKHLTYYLDDTNYIDFTKNFGGESMLYIEDFTITTDQSILPFVEERVDTGGVISQPAIKSPYVVTTPIYCSFAIFKSGISRYYRRNFEKLDSLLSYIGGLFGTITILLFMVNTYNGHSFEVTLGGSLFEDKFSQKGKRIQSYNFLSFIAHQIYLILDSIGCSPNWKSIKQYDSQRQEAVKQLDVLYLLERVSFLEKTINILLDNHQLKGVHLVRNISLEEAKEHRIDFKLKKKLLQIKPTSSVTINKDTTLVNDPNQSSTLLPSNILNDYQFQTLNNDVVLQMKNKTITKMSGDNNQKYDNQNVTNFKEFVDNQSDSDDQQDYDHKSWIEKIALLKKQAETGNKISKKVWQNIGQGLKLKFNSILESGNYNSSQSSFSQSNNEKSVKQMPAVQPKVINQKPRRLQKIKSEKFVVKQKNHSQQNFYLHKNEINEKGRFESNKQKQKLHQISSSHFQIIGPNFQAQSNL